MSLYGSMRTAVSGMNAQANRLAAVGDNIANSSTTGYKGASVSFSSLVLPSTSGNYNSGSVSSSTNYSISEQGALTYTTSKSDLAIQGEGFFVVQDASGAIFLTRAGDFTADEDGYLVNSAGYTLLGSPYNGDASPTVVVNSYDGLEPVKVGSNALSASASTRGTLVTNLPYSAEPVGGVRVNVAPSENSPYSGYTYKMSQVDDAGNTDIYYTKLADNKWEVTVYANDSGTSTGFPYDVASGAVVTATTTLTFDPDTGAIIDGDTKLYPDPSDPYYLDFSGLTQQASAASSMLTVNFKQNMQSDAPKIDVPGGDQPASANVAGVVYSMHQSATGLPGLPAGKEFDVYYTKTDDFTWEVTVYDAADATSGGFPYGTAGSAPLATLILTYDPATGALTSGASTDIVLSGGQALTLDFTGSVSIPDLTAGWEDGVNVSFNLPATAPAVLPSLINATPADNVASSTFTNKTSLAAYDSYGGLVLLDIYYTKGEDGAWEVSVFDNAGATNGGFPYSNGPLATTLLQFDPQTGKLSGGADLSLEIPNGDTLLLDFYGTTQLATGFMVGNANVNGSAASAATGYSISDDGTIYAQYGTGDLEPLYRMAIAAVQSPDNLAVLSGNVYRTTASSGVVTLGYAGQSGFGSIVSGALETSNVDLASELTEMIESQRSYTANSKVFQTGSDMMESLLNLVR